MTKNAANACGDSWSKCNRCAAVAQATIVHQAHARKDETTALKGRRIAARNLRGHLATIAVTAPDLRGHLAATTAARNLRGHRAGTIAARNLLGRLATTNVVRNLRGRLAATALVARNLHGRDPRVVEALSRHGPATVPNAAVAIRRWTGVHLAARLIAVQGVDTTETRGIEVTTAVVTRDPVAAPTVMIAETRPVVNAEAEADEAKEVVEAVESRSLLIML